MQPKLITLMLLLGATCSMAASITDNPYQNSSSFYKRGDEGWYWYHDPILEEEEEPLLKDAPPPTTPALAPFSAQWTREMLPKYRDLAWDNPTPENVEAYFLIQRFAMDRSEEFADVSSRVISGNPYLDENARRSTNTYGSKVMDYRTSLAFDDMIAVVAKKAGLFFFFKSDCPYCEAQAPLIKILEEVNGFTVIAISVDGSLMKDVQFKNTRIDQGHAEQLQVSATPSLFLVTTDGHFESLGQGVMSLPDLKQRILIGAARAGVLTEQEINQTRPIQKHDEFDLSQQFKPLLTKADESSEKSLVKEDGFIEPKALLSLLKDKRLSGTYREVKENE